MNCIAKSNHLTTPNSHVTPSDLIRVKMFVFKHCVFLRDIWNFNKWKSLIINKKCWMLWRSNAKENNNFAIKMISTENVEGESSIFNKKIMEEVRRKSQTYFSSKFWPIIYKEWFIWTKDHHRCLPFVIQNVWLGQGLTHIWTLNYTLKTRWTWSSKYKKLFQNISRKQI